MPEKNLTLFNLLLDETCPWETLHEQHKAFALEILARIIAASARSKADEEKNYHE